MPSFQRLARFTLVVTLVLLLVLYLRNGAADAGAVCKVVSAATSSHVLLKGTLLTPAGAVPNGCVLVKYGKIARLGRSSLECQGEADATVVDCKAAVISPGFINTHEHLDYATVSPMYNTGNIYGHRHDWRLGLRGYAKRLATINAPELDAARWGELRHIFSGTTSVMGGHMAPGLARNLDFAEGLGDDLDSLPGTYAVFPLDDAQGIVRSRDCDYGPGAIDQKTARNLNRYVAHVAEGVDYSAANEFRCLSNEKFDTTPLPTGGGLSTNIISSKMVLVHALALTKVDFDLVAKRDAKVVWSPRSNVFLYGKTLDVNYLLKAGITVALGTDWLPTGSATMAREAACALSATKTSYGETLSSETLWKMMTINAAKVAGFEDHLGSLKEGMLADIVVFSGNKPADPFSQAVFGQEENIQLVMRGGKVLVAGSHLGKLTRGPCETLQFGRVRKLVCVEDELKSTYSEFHNSIGGEWGVYPAILPGMPPLEPSCEPSR